MESMMNKPEKSCGVADYMRRVSLLGADGRIVWLNIPPAGHIAEELIGAFSWSFVSTSYRASLKAALGSTLVSGEPSEVPYTVEKTGIAYRAFVERVDGVALVATISKHELTPVLTPREKEVLLAICQDMSVPQICERLGLARATFDTYRQTLKRKTGAKGTSGLVQYAIRHALFIPD